MERGLGISTRAELEEMNFGQQQSLSLGGGLQLGALGQQQSMDND